MSIEYYDAKDVPDWVDHVYTADLIVQQYDYHGTYIHGFINSLFGQRDVTVTTEGYNYIAIGDDVYMYTGITSVVSDQSNIGFILSNQRTKETRFYSVAGAEEYSAMDSARGQVQQMNYTATFPLLLNIADQPSYFMALKDAAGLVKMYAMVNVSQYQIVATGGSVAECESNYRQMLARYNLIDPADTEPSASDQGEVTGVIADLRSAVMDGNTWYYLQLLRRHGVLHHLRRRGSGGRDPQRGRHGDGEVCRGRGQHPAGLQRGQGRPGGVKQNTEKRRDLAVTPFFVPMGGRLAACPMQP